MAGFVPRNRAESALRFLPQKISTFEPFHTANHMFAIRDMLDHLEKDDVLTHVVAAIRRHLSLTARSWYDDTVKKGAPQPLPADPVSVIAFRLDMLKQVRLEKIDLRYLTASFYPGEHLNERLMHWKRAIVHPLAEDLRRLATELLGRLPSDERFDMEALTSDVLDGFSTKAFGSRAWTDADDAAAEAKASAPDATADARGSAPRSPVEALERSLDALGRAIAGASALSEDERHDLALEAKIIAAEIRRGRRENVAARLDALAARPALAAAAGEVKKRL